MDLNDIGIEDGIIVFILQSSIAIFSTSCYLRIAAGETEQNKQTKERTKTKNWTKNLIQKAQTQVGSGSIT